MILIPYGEEFCSNIQNILKISLKLAKVNAYNDDLIMEGKHQLNISDYISSLFKRNII